MFITDKIQAQINFFKDFEERKGAYVAELLSEKTEDLLGLQRDQLASGLNSNGGEMQPPYPQDLKPGGYFHTQSAAERYSEWKDRMQVPVYYKQTARKHNVPNLYINGTDRNGRPIRNGGRFYSEIVVDVDESRIFFHGSTDYSEGIMAKFGVDNFGLNEEYWRYILENGILDSLIEKLRSNLLAI